MLIGTTFPQFEDSDGSPLNAGSIYFGVVGLNPETDPISVYWDDAFTIPAVQPIRTLNGFIVRDGAIANLYCAVNYSITVRNKNGILLYSLPDSSKFDINAFLPAIFSGSNGSSLVGFLQGGTGAVVRTAQSKLREWVTPKDFGAVGDGVTDDTAAFALAITYAKATSAHLAIVGTYKVTKVTFDTCNGLTVFGMGALVGAASGAYEAVLVVKNSSDVTFTGRLVVSANWNSSYTSAIAVYTDNATQASTLFFDGVSCVGAKLGWKFGRVTEPDPLISEITVKGGYLYGCPSAVEAWGTQTVVSFIGCQLITGTNGGSGAWLTLPRCCVKSIGALITIIGGEALITDVTNGVLAQLEPVTSVTYGNQYNTIIFTSVVIESASQYCNIANPSAISSLVAGKGLIEFKNCTGYHSQNAFAMINAVAEYTGRIVAKDNNFYAGSVRSQANINCAGNLCDVYIDDMSFGKNFVQGLVGVLGGILHFDRRQILYVSNTNSQAFASGVSTVIKFISPTNTQDTQHFNSYYSAATGQFTVPPGGLKSVAVNFALRTTLPTQPIDLAVYLAGVFYAAIPTMMGGAGNTGFARGCVELGDIAAGVTIDIRATQYGGASTANAGQYENLAIIARN